MKDPIGVQSFNALQSNEHSHCCQVIFRSHFQESHVKMEMPDLQIYARLESFITDEKWSASGESNIFRLSRDYVSGLS